MDDPTSADSDQEPDLDTPVLLDKQGNPKPQATEYKPHRGSDPATPKLMAARVQRIALIMASGEWGGYPTAYALAVEWNLKVSTVQGYACRASWLLDRTVEEDEEIRARIKRTLDTAIARSMAKGRFRDVIEGCKVLAGLQGLDKTAANGKENTVAVVGLDELVNKRIREAVAANATEIKDGSSR